MSETDNQLFHSTTNKLPVCNLWETITWIDYMETDAPLFFFLTNLTKFDLHALEKNDEMDMILNRKNRM